MVGYGTILGPRSPAEHISDKTAAPSDPRAPRPSKPRHQNRHRLYQMAVWIAFPKAFGGADLRRSYYVSLAAVRKETDFSRFV